MRVEFKPNWKYHNDDIRADVCAFANDLPGSGETGVVIIGVANDGNPSGYEPTEEDARSVAHMANDGNIHPFPLLEVETVRINGSRCIVVSVARRRFSQ